MPGRRHIDFDAHAPAAPEQEQVEFGARLGRQNTLRDARHPQDFLERRPLPGGAEFRCASSSPTSRCRAANGAGRASSMTTSVSGSRRSMALPAAGRSAIPDRTTWRHARPRFAGRAWSCHAARPTTASVRHWLPGARCGAWGRNCPRRPRLPQIRRRLACPLDSWHARRSGSGLNSDRNLETLPENPPRKIQFPQDHEIHLALTSCSPRLHSLEPPIMSLPRDSPRCLTARTSPAGTAGARRILPNYGR